MKKKIIIIIIISIIIHFLPPVISRCQQLPAPYKRLIHDGN